MTQKQSPDAPSPNTLTGLRLVFRTLQYRNYRLFFGGQIISLVGTWMQQVALIWLVYRMTNSAFLLGVVGFAGQLPAFIMGPFAGVSADRVNRHRALFVTQGLSMLQATILAVLTLTGNIAVWHIIALSVLLGIVNAFDIPIRQSFLLEMIENRDDLGNAIALNSSMFNGARLIGPAIAGVLIAAIGEGPCFLLNAISYIAVILALVAMKIPPRQPEKRSGGVFTGFAEGFRYAFGFLPIRNILLLLALVSVMGLPYSVLMPIFARDILGGGPHTLGFLMSATGVGAMTGALLLASRKNVRGLGRWISSATVTFGLGLIAFSFSRAVPLSMLLLFMVGFGMMVQMASSNTILQTIVDDDKRGRIMSFYMMAFMGMTPIGSLLAGIFASTIGAPYTLMLGGMACIAGGVLFANQLPELRKEIRPIYQRLGIVPEVSAGLQAATQLTIPPAE